MKLKNELQFVDKKGEIYFIRPILPSDKAHLKNGFSKLSTASIRQRFHFAKKDFTEHELINFTEVDQQTHLALVAYQKISNIDQLLPMGVIRGIKSTHDNTLEIALTVIDEFQQRGLGKKLIEVLYLKARELNFEGFRGEVQKSNDAMILLLKNFSINRAYFQKISIDHDLFEIIMTFY